MAENDRGPDDGPSLELPSLFRSRARGRRRADAAEPAADFTPDLTAPPTAEPPAEVVPESVMTASPEPVVTAAPERRRPRGGARRAEPETAPREPRRPLAARLPAVPPSGAALITGLVVGLLGVLLTWLALQGCEAIRGSESCGGPGIFALLAIVVVMGLAGVALLRLLGVADAGPVSFLAIGMLCVVLLTFVADRLTEDWAAVLVPLLTAASYAAAQWVTTRFADVDIDA